MSDFLVKKKVTEKQWPKGVVIGICLLIVFGAVSAVYFLYFNWFQEKENICLTEDCLKATLNIVSSMNAVADPCEDFYEFTCGKFMDRAYENNYPSQYFMQKVRTKNQLNSLIIEPVKGNEWEPLQLQKSFYQSCMNESATEENEAYLLELLEQISGWAEVKRHVFQNFELDKVMIECIKFGLPFEWFFEIKMDKDLNKIYIDVPIVRENFKDSLKESAYFDLAVEIIVLLGASRSLATNQTVVFEEALLKLVEEEATSYRIPLDEDNVLTSFPRYNLFQLIDILTEDWNHTFLMNNTEVNTNYLVKLNNLLAVTPKSVQASYVFWKIVEEFGMHLSLPIRQNFGNFSNFMLPKYDHADTRSEICVKETLSRFPNIAEMAYIGKYVDEETYWNIKEMVSNIKNRLTVLLENAEWLDEDVRNTAINKVNNIIEIIGDHRLDFDDDLLDIFLNVKDLEFTSGNIIDMIREKNMHDFNRRFSINSTKKIDELTKEIVRSATKINAVYIEAANLIMISAALIQDIFYSNKRPNYLNYGLLGSIIGHEISHGLGQYALAHDSEEEIDIWNTWFNKTLDEIDEKIFSINDTDLWRNESLAMWISRTRCIVNQYEEFQEGVDGEEMLPENFADLLGINTAYETYVKWVEDNYEEEKLPGLPYTPNQLFWIHFGTIHCYKDIGVIEKETGEDHPSFRYRVLNSVRNSHHFSKDFNCPLGTPMNPYDKCQFL